jgi:hypothetical protein
MRGSRLQGRFDVDGYESLSIYEGMREELAHTVGTIVDWWVWNTAYIESNYSDVVDDIYDVSIAAPEGNGRRWKEPIQVEVIAAQFVTGSNVMNTRGFYTTDTLRLTVGADEMRDRFPGFLETDDPSNHIRDHIVFKGQVYRPTVVMPRGHFAQKWAVVTIQCNQVNPEELVNDPQFQQYALGSVSEPRTAIYGAGGFGTGKYGE